jgi:hypothetical protein
MMPGMHEDDLGLLNHLPTNPHIDEPISKCIGIGYILVREMVIRTRKLCPQMPKTKTSERMWRLGGGLQRQEGARRRGGRALRAPNARPIYKKKRPRP